MKLTYLFIFLAIRSLAYDPLYPFANSITSQRTDLGIKQALSSSFGLNSNLFTSATNNTQIALALNSLGFYPHQPNAQVTTLNLTNFTVTYTTNILNLTNYVVTSNTNFYNYTNYIYNNYTNYVNITNYNINNSTNYINITNYTTITNPVTSNTVLALSASYVDVTNAIQTAYNIYTNSGIEQTVIIPPGSANWSNSITLLHVSLVGSGTNQTVISDTVTNGLYSDSNGGSPADPLIQAYSDNTSHYVTRISNFTIKGTGIPTLGYPRGRILLGVSSDDYTTSSLPLTNSPFVVNNMVFDHLEAVSIQVGGSVSALIKSCYFTPKSTAVKVLSNLHTHNDYDNGDWAWANPPDYGSQNCVVVEDCTIVNTIDPNNTTLSAMDGWAGSKMTFRHNTVIGTYFTNHGTETSGRFRSGRWCEVYNNTFIGQNGPRAINIRGGSGVVFSNNISGYNNASIVDFTVDRDGSWYPPFGIASGTNKWDSNLATNVITGVHSGLDGSTYLEDTNANWTINQWVGYTIVNNSTNCNVIVGNNGFRYQFVTCANVSSNSTTRLYYPVSQNSTTPWLTWTNGDSYSLNKVGQMLDSIGNGSGDLIINFDPTNSIGGYWPHEVIEPVYVWGNTVNGSPSTYVGIPSSLTIGTQIITNSVKPGYTPLVYPHPLAL